MSNQMLILFAIFAERSQRVGAAAGIAVQQAQQAMAVFSFFLWLVYGFFGLVLGIFRNEVVKQGTLSCCALFLPRYPNFRVIKPICPVLTLALYYELCHVT
jgi:hypothetical protein